MFAIIIKLVHILSVGSYFFGIFYVGQLFLNYKYTEKFTRAKKKILRRQYLFNIERTWNMLVVPSGLIMLVTGIIMFFFNKHLVKMQWFDLKLIFLCMLSTYHYWFLETIRHLKALQGYDFKITRIKLQQINEVGILLMLLLGCSVILKYTIMLHYGLIITGIIIIMILLVAVLKLLKKEK
ncbi:putative membrane protein [Chryseobacterium bernardetii]|jgi:putative membrane protein|uniref:Membrane protein n=1 Tax=Chryseobacterium bernardetii TaxID=1241978 RepID=A0ACC6IUX6_9FLAO|nr:MULTISPECIES: CopD family protein [Chryseobacterium]MDR6441394.1 putative membrane protein [Chryseobacterium bernardetii]